MRLPAFGLTGLAWLLAVGTLLVGCTAPLPPNRPPDLEGTVIGRTPRLPQRDGATRLVISAPPVRVDVALGPGVRVLEAVSADEYRSAETGESWGGRVVHVWYAADTGRAQAAPLPAGVISRRASYVVLTQGW